jgi:signal transduction histidine kinase
MEEQMMLLSIKREHGIMPHRSENNTTNKHMGALPQRESMPDYADHVRSVIHDLKSPLTSILLQADLIGRFDGDKLSVNAREHLEKIQQIGLDMSKIMDQLLQPSERRCPTADGKVIQILPIVSTIVEAYELQIKNQDISVIISPDLPVASAHPDRVTAIFTNLIGNAIKYIGDENTDPYIRIHAFHQGDMVRYEVQDNGVGIKPDDQPHVFDHYTRFHGTLANGSGLGLVIVKSIVTKIGGQVGVDSKPGQGSTFWFTLPASTQS